jgi:hypothetical protein
MNTTRSTCLAGLATFALASIAFAQTPVAPPPAPIPVISPGKNTVSAYPWMVGCWQAKTARDGATINETWLAPQSGTLMGVGQTYRDGKSIGWEAMRMYDEGEGVKLWLRPGLRNEVTFSLESAGDNFAAFAIKEGDTVTKLRYERKSETEMLATFRVEQGDNRRGADFAFAKLDCAEFFATAAKAPANR